MTHTLLVARLWFEGNRFACRPSTLADFEQREWARGDEALAAAAGTATELGAVAEFAHCSEISPRTIDPDFERNPRIHRCWELRRI